MFFKRKRDRANGPVTQEKGNDMEAQIIQDHRANSQDRFWSSKTEFSKQLRWLIKEVPDGSILMTVTPLMAEEILRLNTRNRPQSLSTVKKYAEEIKSGRWMQTGVPLIISKTGFLLDGQHRNAAVIMANIPVEFHVIFGIDDAAFAFIDRGKTRTAADIFAIHGVENYVNVASAIRWVWLYDQHAMSGNAGTSPLNPDQLYDYYEDNLRLSDSAHIAYAFARSKLAAPSLMMALHYICARKARGQADEFFQKVADGVGFTGKGEPAYRLREFLLNNREADAKLGRVNIAALTINAWNAHRRGRSKFPTSLETGKAFPRAT